MADHPKASSPSQSSCRANVARACRRHGCRVVVSLAVLLIPFVAICVLNSSVHPTTRGFFCNDDSISFPKKPNTVSDPVLLAICIGCPLLIIILFSVSSIMTLFNCNSHHDERSGNPVMCGLSRRLDVPLTWNDLLCQCYWFILGFVLVSFFTETGKVAVGRLRPYFLDACQPDYSKFNCTNEKGFPLYILHPGCRGKSGDIHEARLSWPSGHSSVSVYAGVFVMLYLEATCIQKFSSPLKVFLQVIPATLAFLCCLSRISDNAHHWSDVLSGTILGASVAVATVFTLLSFVRNKQSSLSTAERNTLL